MWDWQSIAIILAGLGLLCWALYLFVFRGPAEFSKGLRLLDLGADILPMFGIMGTVWGIYQTFALFSDQNSVALSGIFEKFAPALMTTLVGLGGAAVLLIVRHVADGVGPGQAPETLKTTETTEKEA